MRMWMCDPKIMCQKHLCGEHLELHMFLGAIKKGKKITGFLKNNLLHPTHIYKRHEELKNEMIKRKYRHCSEMIEKDFIDTIKLLSIDQLSYKIEKSEALRVLLSRCPECLSKFNEII